MHSLHIYIYVYDNVSFIPRPSKYLQTMVKILQNRRVKHNFVGTFGIYASLYTVRWMTRLFFAAHRRLVIASAIIHALQYSDMG